MIQQFPKLGENEILLKVGACGLGREVSGVSANRFAGEIIKKGRCVSRFAPGDLASVGTSDQSGLTELAVLSEDACYSLRELLEYTASRMETVEAGALIHPTAVAYHSLFVQEGGFRPGGNVVVYGANLTGLGAVALAGACGGNKIIVFEPDEERRIRAKAMGAGYVYDPDRLQQQDISFRDVVMDITKGRGAARQIVTADLTERQYGLLDGCRAAGGRTIRIDAADLSREFDREIYQSVINLMSSGRIDMRMAIDRRIPLGQLLERPEQMKSVGGDTVIVSQYYTA